MYEFKLWKPWQESITTDYKTNYDAEANTSDDAKITNRRKRNSQNEANNMQLDKEDTQRSNLDSFPVII